MFSFFSKLSSLTYYKERTRLCYFWFPLVVFVIFGIPQIFYSILWLTFYTYMHVNKLNITYKYIYVCTRVYYVHMYIHRYVYEATVCIWPLVGIWIRTRIIKWDLRNANSTYYTAHAHMHTPRYAFDLENRKQSIFRELQQLQSPPRPTHRTYILRTQQTASNSNALSKACRYL